MSSDAPIAIIGMACIFPQAADLAGFWRNILAGTDAVGEPLAEWQAQRYLDSGRINTQYGGYLGDLYRFDPREFGIMPNSVDGGEPDQFLALKVAFDALSDAGYAGDTIDHRDTGIILGHSTYLHRGQVSHIQNHIVLDQTLALLQAAQPSLSEDDLARLRTALQKQLPPSNADIAPGLVPNVMTGRIANRLNLKGPNYIVDAACSSSLLAVNAAMDELRSGRSRLMIAGGVNASLPAEVSVIFTQLGALSGRGKVRPFEQGSDGTLLGEGLGMVVLKRLDDALADGDRIYAVLRGIGQASDGRGTGLLAPSEEGEALSIRRAYESCGVDPASISLVEAHGTGIPLGDQTEIAALRSVLGARQGLLGSVAIGSVKSMISHCIPAAGIAGLIKTSLALHHKVLPPTLCGAVNPALGIDTTPLYVNTAAKPWIARPQSPRRAGINSFGFGGINTHAVLEEAPATALRPRSLARRDCELCVFAGTSRAELQQQVQQVLAYLEQAPALSLGDLAATLAARDSSGKPVRLAVLAGDVAELAKKLQQALKKLDEAKGERWMTRTGMLFSSQPLQGKLAFLFPGEGSQYLNMLADLAQHFAEVREWFDFWQGLYDETPGSTRSDILFPPASELTDELRQRLEARLFDMDVGSEAVFVASQALFSLLGALGVEPDAMLGHSTGESSALAASGAIAFTDRAQLADFIRELNQVYRGVLDGGGIATGALLTVGALKREQVERHIGACAEPVAVAMDNCQNQLVLFSGRATIEGLLKSLSEDGGICSILPFDRAYHTPLFAAVTTAFHQYYRDVGLQAPKTALYSCASAELFPADSPAVCELAAAQWSNTVRFRETIANMHRDGVRYFVEVGPSGNLTGFVNDILGGEEYLAIASNARKRSGLEQLFNLLGALFVNGRPVDLGKLHRGQAGCLLDLTQPPVAAKRGLLLKNTLPFIQVDAPVAQLLRELMAPVALPAAPLTASEIAAPLLDEIQRDGSTRLTASCPLWSTDRFLADHVLSGPSSYHQPELQGLACVAMMASLETMAEACAVLAGSTAINLIENVRAYDWVALDLGQLTLQVEAERQADGRYLGRLHNAGSLLMSAEFSFAAPLSGAPLADLTQPVGYRWPDHQLYSTGMFHGPLFQSIAAIPAWAEQGIDAQLASCSTHGFVQDGEPCALVLNPVLLDALGQLAAYWLAQQVGTDFNSFPSHIARIELHAPLPADLSGAWLRGRQRPVDVANAGLEAPRTWTFDCLHEGRLLLHASGFANLFFPVPNAFYELRREPLNGWLGAPLESAAGGTEVLLWQLEQLPEDFCKQSAAIFLRILAHAVLAPEEREEWESVRHSRRAREWLHGRLCLKEATRYFIYQQTGELLCPADVRVWHDALGAPYVDGWWNGQWLAAPALSLSHDRQTCVAALVPAGAVGVDVERLDRLQRPELVAGSFTPYEQQVLATVDPAWQGELTLRTWCAKEAAAKYLGCGLRGEPQAFEVQFAETGELAVVSFAGDASLAPAQVSVAFDIQGDRLIALAGAELDFQEYGVANG
ncbi:beta-ketoacyl synthase [Pseudomonas alcaligenes]|uniref:Beta-ketoacyl synthase n=1 Tax=Aquipseudomonas alcaligenes TaxID=43263 RepID=A0ABR7S5V7_AQUAC|nr:type I polyketide synthase [Pseudomonas alcaligenes]MBC9251838.1 beta-ketoacyl synthase [Pseudomonas alcaligenes]